MAAWAIAFAIGLGELPATNLVAPPGTQPMPVVIWGLLHTGVESHLSGVALIMLIVVSAQGLAAAAVSIGATACNRLTTIQSGTRGAAPICWVLAVCRRSAPL